MPRWPDTLPSTPRYGWEETPQPNTRAYKPDVGAPKLRRRSTARSDLVTGIFEMTDDERLEFDEFYDDDLKDGSLPFDFDDPVTGQTLSYVFEEEPRKVREKPGFNTIQVKWRKLR